jgi:hypothetical protein
MESPDFALVAISITSDDGGDIEQSSAVTATIKGPAEAVLGMLDVIVNHKQAVVLSARADDGEGNSWDMLDGGGMKH